MTLTSVDYELLLSAVNFLNSDCCLETLPARTLDSVFSLIPNEMVAFDGFGTDSNYTGNLWYSPPGTVPDERIQLLGNLMHEHPFYRDVIIGRRERTERVTHYVSLAEFHRTELYNEFYKHIGGDSQMCSTLVVSPDLYVACSLHRLMTDFTDREWELMNLFSPHLASTFRNAQFVQRLNEEVNQIQTALTAAKFGVIALDLDLRMQYQNQRAIEILHKYFSLSGELPDEIRRYVRYYLGTFAGDDFYLPPAPLEIEEKGSRLTIRLAFESQSSSVIVLMSEVTKASPERLRSLGVTQRESEILFWLSEGKTNQEIGVLCDISPRTVQKHLENIFPKLGVETRTAAAGVVFDLLKSQI